MNMPSNSSAGLESRRIAVLHRADLLRAEYANEIQLIVERHIVTNDEIREVDAIIDEIACECAQILFLDSSRFLSSLRVVVHQIIHSLLTEEELAMRRRNRSSANARKAHGHVNYSKIGKLGGKERIKKGPIQADFWSEDELRFLLSLCENDEYIRQKNPHKGHFDLIKITEAFQDHHPSTLRTKRSIQHILTPSREKTQKTWAQFGLPVPVPPVYKMSS